MLSELDRFYKGLGSLVELESALEIWENEVKEMEDRDVYSGDMYYQEALETRSAIQEAIDNYGDYYDENDVFIG